LTQLAQGRVEAAQRQAHHLHRFLVENGLVDLTIFADALLHYLNLLTGNVVQVSERYAQNLPGQLGLDLWLSPAFVLALAQIRQGATSSWRQPRLSRLPPTTCTSPCHGAVAARNRGGVVAAAAGTQCKSGAARW
jgi:hypothetical protein